MKRFLAALGIFAGLVVLLIAFFRLNFYEIHVRYRLTIEVRDRGQIKSGSSVIDAPYTIEPDWSPSGPGVLLRFVGYAPTVDLGEKGLFFLTFEDAVRTPDQNPRR